VGRATSQREALSPVAEKQIVTCIGDRDHMQLSMQKDYDELPTSNS